jgi:hypothetical protein|tara:strand:- start:240 stop:737 length:498 start_codon:yes stop_codon:yes gene_type:complete
MKKLLLLCSFLIFTNCSKDSDESDSDESIYKWGYVGNANITEIGVDDCDNGRDYWVWQDLNPTIRIFIENRSAWDDGECDGCLYVTIRLGEALVTNEEVDGIGFLENNTFEFHGTADRGYDSNRILIIEGTVNGDEIQGTIKAGNCGNGIILGTFSAEKYLEESI